MKKTYNVLSHIYEEIQKIHKTSSSSVHLGECNRMSGQNRVTELTNELGSVRFFYF